MSNIDVNFTGEESANRLSGAVDKLYGRVTQLGSGLVGLGERSLSATREAVAFAGQIAAAADQVARLATESANLERNAERLGLNFDDAAEAAGRFTDETDVMAQATRFAEAGVRMQQQELNALTRVAAAYSQNAGVPMAAAMQQLSDGVLAGTEALRRFGPEMAALQGPAHTVGERLQALVLHAREVPQATDDASTAMERMRDTFGDAEREMARGFTEELRLIHAMGSGLNSAADDADELNHTMRAAGQTAADMAVIVGSAFAIIIASIPAAIHGLYDLLAGAARASAALAHGDLEGARNAFRLGDNSRAVGEFVNARGADINSALERMFGSRTQGDGGPARAPARDPNSMTFTPEEARAAEADAATRERRGSSSSGGQHGLTGKARQAAAEAEADRFQRTEEEAAKARRAAMEAADPRNQDQTEVDKARQAMRQAAEEAERQRQSDEDKARRAAAEAEVDRRERETDLRVRLFEREHDAAQFMRDGIVGAYDDITEAAGEWLVKLVEGVDGASAAFQAFAANRLRAISLEAAGQAVQAGAEGLYYLFTAPPIAATKFAAAAKFGLLAAGAGIAGYAIAPTGGPSAGAGASRPAGGPAPRAALDGGGSGGGGPTIVNINVTSGLTSTPRDNARAVRRVLSDGTALTGIPLPANVLGGF